jgi:Tfp pilus assembly protein PilF
LQAGAHEDLGRPAAARANLRDALQLEPDNFVTYALLGDLETRTGRLARAKRFYSRAADLNPRDIGLRQLSRGDSRE